MGAIPLLDKAAQLLRGQSYWRVKLTSGRTFSELDHAVKFTPDPLTGRLVARSRAVEWLEDIVGSGSTANISQIALVTPHGTVSLEITEPETAFQFKRGIVDMFGGGRHMEAQIIGRLENRETGACVTHIWDGRHQQLFANFSTSVKDFASWRPGEVIAPGQLAYHVVGVRVT
jgi:hypothetical protein